MLVRSMTLFKLLKTGKVRVKVNLDPAETEGGWYPSFCDNLFYDVTGPALSRWNDRGRDRTCQKPVDGAPGDTHTIIPDGDTAVAAVFLMPIFIHRSSLP